MDKKNVKVGVMTWHYYPNYGSVLQAYALQTFINKKLNIECEVIDYRSYDYSPKGILKLLKNNRLTYKLICKFFKKERAYRFYNFVNENLNLSNKEINTLEELEKINGRYNVFICGSDQIWAANVLNKRYLLDFVNDRNIKISYAPSIVIKPNNEEQKNIYNKYIKRFNYLSVREKKGQDIIKSITGISPDVVLDPTLLLDEKDYEDIIKIEYIKEPYILCYLLGDNKKHIKYINRFSEKNNLKVVALINNKSDLAYGDYNIYTSGPKEFLGYIKNSSFVITDSFHGVNFSIIYKKNFIVFERFNGDDPICQNDRIYNILSKLSLEDRIIKDLSDIRHIENINYSYVNSLLCNEREQSILYLKKALNIEGR